MNIRHITAGVIALLAATAALITPVMPAMAAQQVPTHVLEESDVPADHRMFILDTSKTRMADVRFDKDWTTSKGDAGEPIHWPTRIGASATLPDVGSWNGRTVSMTVSLAKWNGGNIAPLEYSADDGSTKTDGLFWINTVYRNDLTPAVVRKVLGDIDTTRRVGNTWTVRFSYADGTPLPDEFKGMTGFNDLDGWAAQPDLKFEGVQLLDGFDGAYMSRDAKLASYGTNGFVGVKEDAGIETDLDGTTQRNHRLTATWTGDMFTFSYDLQNPTGRTGGCRMTFGTPVTQLYPLHYDGNGAQNGVTPQQKQ